MSSSVVPFSSCLQSFPASGFFLMSQLFATQVAKILELQLQPQSFQWIFRTDFLLDWLVWSPCSPRDSQESSPTPQFKKINYSVFSIIVWLTVCKWSISAGFYHFSFTFGKAAVFHICFLLQLPFLPVIFSNPPHVYTVSCPHNLSFSTLCIWQMAGITSAAQKTGLNKVTASSTTTPKARPPDAELSGKKASLLLLSAGHFSKFTFRV